MDPPSETGFPVDAYSSPIAAPTHSEEQGYNARVADLPSTPIKETKKSKKSKKGKVEDLDEIALWSPAKRQSWEARKTNPNAFYYRHVEPGQVKKTGAWDESEKALFMKVIKLHPPSQGKWGIFARNIPGRVGYQCRNFYHRLLESGELKEDTVPGENTKAKPEKKKRQRKPKVQVEVEEDDEPEEPVEVASDRNDDADPDENEQEEPEVTNDVTNKPTKSAPKQFNIKTLKLFSTRLNAALAAEPEDQEETDIPVAPPSPITEFVDQNPIEAVEIAVENVERQVELAEEISMPSSVKSKDIEVEDAMCSPHPPRLSWNKRMPQPWRRLEVVPEKIEFPHEESEARPDFEYQCSKILRLNKDSQINLILLSFPAPKGYRHKYIKAVRSRLAQNESGAVLARPVREYFRVKQACIAEPARRDELLKQYVEAMISGSL